MEIYKKIKKTFPNLALFTLSIELENILKDCDTILDLGCGVNSPLGLLSTKKRLIGIDLYSETKKTNKHQKIYNINVLNIDNKFKNNSFDAVVALDLIEHLEKKDGYKLIKKMGDIARKKIVILTPNGFLEQKADKNKFQEHKSGWNIYDFKKINFRVKGIYGIKLLRKEKAELRRPKIFWGLISELSHYLITRNFPKYSFSLLCTKEINV